MIPAEEVKMVCENIGLDFTNQGVGALSIQLAHSNEMRPKFSRDFLESIYEEQEGVFSECETNISLSWQTENGQCLSAPLPG